MIVTMESGDEDEDIEGGNLVGVGSKLIDADT